jgi:hypothetical protein
MAGQYLQGNVLFLKNIYFCSFKLRILLRNREFYQLVMVGCFFSSNSFRIGSCSDPDPKGFFQIRIQRKNFRIRSHTGSDPQPHWLSECGLNVLHVTVLVRLWPPWSWESPTLRNFVGEFAVTIICFKIIIFSRTGCWCQTLLRIRDPVPFWPRDPGWTTRVV